VSNKECSMKFKTALLGAAAAMALSPISAQAERGSDGHLNIIYWQAASIMNPFLSGGTKDTEAASMVIDTPSSPAAEPSAVR